MIVKNLVEHAGEEKYAQIKLSGKAGQKLSASPAAIRFLQSLGFTTSEDGETLAISNEQAMDASSAAPTAAQHIVAANSTLQQVRMDMMGVREINAACVNKQSARLLMEACKTDSTLRPPLFSPSLPPSLCPASPHDHTAGRGPRREARSHPDRAGAER